MQIKKNKRSEVSIVIPNYNGEELLAKNLPRVLSAQKDVGNRIKEIIIVDDASTDESVKLLKEKFPEVKLVKHKVNRGFSAAVNTGARTAKGKLIALLNNDVVPSKDFLVSALPHFKNKKIFAVSLHEKDFSWAKGKFENGFILHEPGPETNEVHETFWVSGGSGVFRRSLWMKLGGMDEKLFSPFYWEDLDICYRATKRGWGLLWEPNAHVKHKHESTTSRWPKRYVRRIQERNQLFFIWKNLTSPYLFRRHVAGVLTKMVRHPGYIRIVLMALFKLRQVLRARKKEKKETKISDEAIFARF
ncbi:glycosyltransferase family 2 protein [Candidatus Woesebacteria bacterium]|nr:glycosyltransferase family 2 protein [Candidatus Woesebacteria bacterium]